MKDGHRKTIVEIFEEQAFQHPQNIALKINDHSVTYQALNQKANKFARFIKEKFNQHYQQNFSPEAPIVLLLQRGEAAIVSMLALLKLGCAYVPLDINHPFKRINGILQEIQPVFVLTDSAYPHIDAIDFPIFNPASEQLYTDFEYSNLEENLQPENLAYVIYTSGSTGKPKGVMIEQHSIVTLILKNRYLSILPQDNVAHIGNIAFDISTIEIYSALLNGATLVIAPQSVNHSFAQFESYLSEQEVNVLFITPTLFNFYITEDPNLFGTLKALYIGGEALTVEKIWLMLGADRKPQHVFNSYGPTESTVFSNFFQITDSLDKNCRSIPIGDYIEGTLGYVLDENLNECPINTEGELYLGGEGLARGYFLAPELTQEQFIHHPQIKMRLYKTGDRVRQQSDGSLIYLSRMDNQVKIRGHRIELREIESLLNQHPHISQSVAVVQMDLVEQHHIVVYCVLKNVTPEVFESILPDIQDQLAQCLPQYMLPFRYQPVDKIPFNLNGKIDFPQLEKLFTVNPLISGQQKCIDSVHYQILTLWESVFGHVYLDADANFYDLGGTSIQALQLLAQLNEIFQTNLIPAWLIDHPTINVQANEIRNHQCGAFRQIITFSPNNHSPALYMIHPGLIGAECYAEFARRLDRKIHLLGIDSYNLYHEPVKETIEELSDIYVEAILEHSQGKPLYLGGWSLGGIIAYHISCQLQQQGIKVIKLFLIEPDQFSQPIPSFLNNEDRSAELVKHTPDYIISYIATLPEPIARKTLDSFSQDILMTHRYKPQMVINTPTLIFEATQWENTALFGEKIPQENWRTYMNNLHIIPLPGTHLSIMEGECLNAATEIISQHILN